MSECLTQRGVLPEDVYGIHWRGVGKTPQPLAVGPYIAVVYAAL